MTHALPHVTKSAFAKKGNLLMAFQIIRHAFAMIFGNLGQALRVSVGPYLILILVIVGAGAALVGNNGQLLRVMTGEVPPEHFMGQGGGGILLFALVVLVFIVFVAAWVAVSWHRFILLEEYSGMLPAVSGRPIWPYVGRSVLYGFLIALVAFAVGMISSLFMIPFAAAGGDAVFVAGVIIGVVLVAVVSYVWFRIGVALPAVAVGKPISMGDAWRATAEMSSTIFGIVFIIAFASMIAGVATQGLYGLSPILGMVVDIFVQWVTLMVGVSVLTTLYGHLIEGRPLTD